MTTKRTPNPGRPTPKRAGNPAFAGAFDQHAGHKVMRLLGYWVLVQTFGGWEGVAEQPQYSEGSIQRWRLEFLDVFGCHAEDYLPGHDALFREVFYGGAENTWDSAAGVAAQDQAIATVRHKGMAEAVKPATRQARKVKGGDTLHEALGTVKA